MEWNNRSPLEKQSDELSELAIMADALRVMEVFDKNWNQCDFANRVQLLFSRIASKLNINGGTSWQCHLDVQGLPSEIMNAYFRDLKQARENLRGAIVVGIAKRKKALLKQEAEK